MSSELMTTTLPIGPGKKDVELDVIPLEDFTNLKISSSKSEITLDVVTLEDVDNVDAVLSTERYTLEINQPLKGTTTNLARKLSYLVIVFAMISIASGGVAFKMFPDEVTPILACFWRAQAMVVCLIPLVIVEIIRMNKDDRMKLRDGKVWANIVYCGIASSIWSGTFAVALDFSSVTQVYLLNNCQPILLVIWFKLKGRPISIFQATGVGIGMVGLALTIFGESGTAMELTWSDALGDGIAFLGAIFAASYISVGSSTRSQFPGTFTFVVSMWVVSLVVFLAGTLLFERTELSSLFNWYVDGIWPIVLWLALVTGLIGISGVILVMKYLTPLTVSVTLLCEPVVATSLAVIMRIEELPSAVTWVGAVVVMLGVILVSIESRRLKARYPKLFPSISEELTSH